MSIGERIREVRKENGLSLDKFGARIGLKQAVISLMENGKSTVTDQSIRSICREFHVNEDWLRTGEGEPHATLTRTEEIQRIVSAALKSEPESLIHRLVSALAKLDESDLAALEKVWDKITGHAEQTPSTALTKAAAETDEERMEREAREEADEYYKLRLEEKRRIEAEAKLLDGTGRNSSSSESNIA